MSWNVFSVAHRKIPFLSSCTILLGSEARDYVIARKSDDMLAVDRLCNPAGEQPGSRAQDARKKMPEGGTIGCLYAHTPHYAQQCTQGITERKTEALFRGRGPQVQYA